MHTPPLEWDLTMPLLDGSFAVFWLDIESNGQARYYDERGDREMRGLEAHDAAEHLMARVGSEDPAVRERMHRACEFSGEFLLPVQVVAAVREAIQRREPPGIRGSRETVSSLIRPHFLRQTAATLRHHRFAELQPLA